MARRPLTALAPGKQQREPDATHEPELQERERPTPTVRKTTVPPSRQNLKAITSYQPPEVRKQLKAIANEEDTTVQRLMGEALNLLFAKYGRLEIARNDRE